MKLFFTAAYSQFFNCSHKVDRLIIKLLAIVIMLNFVFGMKCFGQESQTNEIVKAEIVQKALLGSWQNYATNTPYTKGIIQQKYEIEARIAGLQKQRLQFIAEDHFNTYTNTPYLIMDDRGHNRVYPSREAYDNEIIGGLIKSSLNLNGEIIKQKKLYYATYGSNIAASVAISLASPVKLKVTNN